MRLTSAALATLIVAGATLLAACAPQATSSSEKNQPEDLQAVFVTLHQTVHAKNDAKAAAAQLQSLLPNEARLKPALRDNVAPDTLTRILDMHKKLGSVSEGDAAKIARPEQKEVRVHGATTEEIVQYRDGSVAYNEFPGGARRVAEQVLRPGMTFYEVEFLEPGKSAGIKYHLLYWDGKQWSMLGPVWGALDAR